jgi:hypothetical protein
MQHMDLLTPSSFQWWSAFAQTLLLSSLATLGRPTEEMRAQRTRTNRNEPKSQKENCKRELRGLEL